MKRNRIKDIFQSKQALIGIIGAVLIGTIGYIWWSKSSWETYEARYSEARQLTKDQVVAIFRLDSDTKEQRQEKFIRLLKLHNEITALKESLCSQSQLVSWQRVMPELGKHEEKCRDTRALLQAFSTQLEKTTSYLRHSIQLAIDISEVPAESETTEADWKGQVETWRVKCDEIKSIGSNEEFDMVKGVAAEACETILKGWEEVIAANEAKNKARYVAATQKLAAAYDTLNKVSDKDTEQLKMLVNNLQEAYRHL